MSEVAEPGGPLPSRRASDGGTYWAVQVSGGELLKRLDTLESKVDILIATGQGLDLDGRLRAVEARTSSPPPQIGDHESRLRILERYAWSLPVAMLTSAAAVVVAVLR